jgi:uncharacterized Zn-binding protein involved in type VI secretion
MAERVCRVDLDRHFGHASPTPNPFHQTNYAEGSPNTFCTGKNIVRIGDKTYCGDPAVEGSQTVFVNGIGVHRRYDGTGGHGSWVPNYALTGSPTLIAG